MDIFHRVVSWFRQAISKKAVSGTFDTYAREGYKRLFQLLDGGSTTYTGKSISMDQALSCSVVWACTKVISESEASMGLPVYRRVGDQRIEQRDLPLWGVLNDAPNEYQTAYDVRETMMQHALNYGNAYAHIVRRGDVPSGDVIGLHLIQPSDVVRINREGRGEFRYDIREDGMERPYRGENIFHIRGLSIDGVTGYPVYQKAKEAIGLWLALEQYGALFFGRGGMPAGMLKKVIPFQDNELRKQFGEDLKAAYQSIEKSHSWLMLEGDWDFKAFGLDPEKMQFVSVRQFMIAEICRWYRVQPHLVADLSRATFSNIEQLALEFVKLTLMPWLTRWEKTIWLKLFTPQQKQNGFYVRHNVNALMRGDFQSRMTAYATLLQNGVMSINEIRELEDKDPIEGGDAHHIQLNMQTVPGTGEETESQEKRTSSLVTISDGARRRAVED
jgi:HK97 family phage portal protein